MAPRPDVILQNVLKNATDGKSNLSWNLDEGFLLLKRELLGYMQTTSKVLGSA